MSRRTAEEQAAKLADVVVGDVDVMSQMAKLAGVSLCQRSVGRSYCTRAVGHDESKIDHPGSRHVVTDRRHVVLAVW